MDDKLRKISFEDVMTDLGYEVGLVENYIFDEITKKLDTYGVENIVERCIEKSDNLKKILDKLSSIENLLSILTAQNSGALSSDWNNYNNWRVTSSTNFRTAAGLYDDSCSSSYTAETLVTSATTDIKIK